MYKIAALLHWPVSGGDGNPLMGVPNEIIKISQRGATKSSLSYLVGHIIWSVDYSTTYDWSWDDKIISRGT